MRRPPPIALLRHYPVTGGIALLSIGMTLAWWGGKDIEPLFMSPRAFAGEPWRMVTSIFPHVGVWHLGFNLYWLWVFGTAIEKAFGQVRTAIIVLALAVGASAAEFAALDGGVGLSGVGYGFFGLLLALRHDPRFADCLDARTIKLFVIWFFICIGTTVTGVMPIANVAHGAGAVLGYVMGVAIATSGNRRIAAGASVVALLVISIVGATIARPYVNLSAHRGNDYAWLGYDAMLAKNNKEAVRWLTRAAAMNDRDVRTFNNLGIAYQELGDYDRASEAYGRLYQLSPNSAEYRSYFLDAKRRAAAQAQDRNQLDDAARLYREIVTIDPNDQRSWAMLADVYQKLGRGDDAKEAATHTTFGKIASLVHAAYEGPPSSQPATSTAPSGSTKAE